MIYVWITIACVTMAGAIFAAVLAAFERWVSFVLFLIVYVIGVVAASVQAVINT